MAGQLAIGDGDIADTLNHLYHCHVTSRAPLEIALKADISMVTHLQHITHGR